MEENKPKFEAWVKIDDKINQELIKKGIDIKKILSEMIEDGYLTLGDENE